MTDSNNIFAQFNKSDKSKNTSNSSEKAPEQIDNLENGILKNTSEDRINRANDDSRNVTNNYDISSNTRRNDIQPVFITQTIDEKTTPPNVFKTAATLLQEHLDAPRISTGSKALDRILGGGIECKSITEFYGAYTTGKTQTSVQIAFNVALDASLGGMGGYAVYIDTEGSFRPERITQMANERGFDPKPILDHILIGRAHNSDIQIQLTDNVYNLAEKYDVKLLIIDSLTSTFRAEFVGKGTLIERQQKLNQHVRQISRIADQLSIAVVVTNQVSAVIDGYEQTVVPIGGHILAHGTTHRVHFTKTPKKQSIRIAKLIASPSLPEASAPFEIVQGGIMDVSLRSFNSDD